MSATDDCPLCGNYVGPMPQRHAEAWRGFVAFVAWAMATRPAAPRRDGDGHFPGCYTFGCSATRCRHPI